MILTAGPWIEGDEIELGRDAPDQPDQGPRIFITVIDAIKHDIFPCDAAGI